MRIRSALIGFCSLLCLASAPGASAKEEKGPADQAPQLISTDGGGPRWKNLKELKAFAAKGDPQACFALGTRMVFGDDEVPVNLTQAHTLLTTAAAGGVADAHFRLGKLYHDGQGVVRDYETALEHYTIAARQGVPEAQHNIGSMLVSARGVKRNYIEGLAWLLVAEKSGAGSDAPQLVRERLARRPDDIRAAERRAEQIAADLPHAVVVRLEHPTPSGPTAPPSLPPTLPPTPPPGIERPAVPQVITPPTIDLAPPPPITIPVDPSLGAPG